MNLQNTPKSANTTCLLTLIKSGLLIMLCFGGQLVFAQQTNTVVKARLDVQTQGDAIIFSAIAENLSAMHKSLQYVFTVFQKDEQQNQSKNTQQGRVILESFQQKKMTEKRTALDSSKKYVGLLLIYENEEIIGKDRVEYPVVLKNDTATNAPVKNSSNDGIVLQGIVTEDTKTKAAKDFYDLFYSAYILNQIQGPKVVSVIEKLSLGRNTIMQIKIGDRVLHEFITKPDFDYLEEMSKLSIRKVFEFFQNLKKQKEEIFQY